MDVELIREINYGINVSGWIVCGFDKRSKYDPPYTSITTIYEIGLMHIQTLKMIWFNCNTKDDRDTIVDLCIDNCEKNKVLSIRKNKTGVSK